MVYCRILDFSQEDYLDNSPICSNFVNTNRNIV